MSASPDNQGKIVSIGIEFDRRLFGRAASLGDRRLPFWGVVARSQWRGALVRLESNSLGACSVGLRRSEIDGYSSGASLRGASGEDLVAIGIEFVGCLFGRATSLGDRRLLWLRRLEIDGYFLPPSDFLGLLALLSLLLALLPLSDDVSDF